MYQDIPFVVSKTQKKSEKEQAKEIISRSNAKSGHGDNQDLNPLCGNFRQQIRTCQSLHPNPDFLNERPISKENIPDTIS